MLSFKFEAKTEFLGKMEDDCLTREPCAVREGLSLNPEFCRWHRHMIRAGLFAPCAPENCPLQQAMAASGGCQDEARLILRPPGISLAQLRLSVGEGRWDLLKDSPDTLAEHLQALISRGVSNAPQFRAEVGPGSASGLARGAVPAQVSLARASELLAEGLLPVVNFIGLGDRTPVAVFDLLTQLAPGSGAQGLALSALLQVHFQAMNAFARARQASPPGARAAEQAGLIYLELFRDRFEAWSEQLAQQAEEPGGPGQAGRGLPAHADLSTVDAICLATATDTADSGGLIFGALIAALGPLDLSRDWNTGVCELLCADPPRDPLEAIVRTQLLFCHFKGDSLAAVVGSVPGEPGTAMRAARYQQIKGQLGRTLSRWIRTR
jgi:hypothetical protein